ncbi:pilus assembly protein PilZ [Sutcliffiella horikoshii]|uniref:Pilus assembly protein PilZ n=1 Tax=Sutcliffiella horikoshii TaxID=79883 RepID=A0A5D4SYK3_9BACI|nr:flagellar brake domain-containing protein [Sutcliffiella horikoshii]TYS68375.1 pilus assembly protein PilZ [Sutcliffiella horikoshii]
MLKPGVVLTLQVKNDDKVEKYRCKVQEVKEKEFYVDYPAHIVNGKTTYILNGTQLLITYVSDEGVAYTFESEVLGRIKQAIPMVQLSFPGYHQVLKVQRRQYVRVESNIDVSVHPLSHHFIPFITLTQDISAGGAALILPEHVSFPEEGHVFTTFVIHLNNGETHYLKLKSKIIRLVEETSKNRWKASLQFDPINEFQRQVLMKYCFEQQLLLRKTHSLA